MESDGYKKLINLINEVLIDGSNHIFIEYCSKKISFKEFKLLKDKVETIINNLTNKFDPILIIGDKSLKVTLLQ